MEDFLRTFDKGDLNPDRATVERESGHVDILIRDPLSMQAVVIENKIEAKDQPEQLRKYYNTTERARL